MKTKEEVRDVENTEEVGNLVRVTINGREYRAPRGSTILEICEANGIPIPSLCAHEDLEPAGICRLCSVEIEGNPRLETACTTRVHDPGMVVFTHSPRVRRARRTILELLLSEHCGDCYTCSRNGNCELQALAEEYGIRELTFELRDPGEEVDDSGPSIFRDMNKCIQCRRCVRVCDEVQSVGALGVFGRGPDTRISTFADMPLGDAVCAACGQCVTHCPTGALREIDHTRPVWEALENPEKHVVIQTAPAIRAAIGECFDLPPGTSVTGQMTTALRDMGFDRVFDTNFTADLTIMEEGTELLLRLKAALVDGDDSMKLPQLTSCSPGWIKYIEYFYPEYLDHVSTCKSPQQMFGSLIKTFYAEEQGIDPESIVTVSVMPCTAKKFEADRPEMTDSGYKDVDYVVTTRELAQMIKEAGIPLPLLEKSHFDEPFGDASGAGLIFGATGGVMEAALRTAYELVTGREVPFDNLNIGPCRGLEGIKMASVKLEDVLDDWSFLEGVELKFAIVHGLGNAQTVMQMLENGEMDDFHFIEVMACPGGCLGGGGQPIPVDDTIRQARADSIYSEDEGLPIRKSHENPHVTYVYDKFLTEGPCGHRSHELLHTNYTARGREL